MHQDDPGLEQRLSRFEAQLDRFSFALHQWQHTQGQTSTEPPADLDQRMRSLEETISREAQALRRLHEEPLKQLQGHAEYLTEARDAPGDASGTRDAHEVIVAATRLARLGAVLNLRTVEKGRG